MNYRSGRLAAEAHAKKFEAALKRSRKQAGQSAVRHFRESFRNEGFTDEGLDKWAQVQRKIPETSAYETATRAQRSRGILRGRGILANSVKVLNESGFKVTIGVAGLKYAAVHNDGAELSRSKIFGRQTRKPFTVVIPKRQFIGNSRVLERKITTQLLKTWEQS